MFYLQAIIAISITVVIACLKVVAYIYINIHADW